MRLLLTVLIIAVITYSPCMAGDYDIIEIPGAAGHRWSPNGQYLSYHLQGKLWVFEVGSGKHTEVSTFHARKYEWLNDSQFVFLKEWHEGKGQEFTRHAELIYVSLSGAREGNDLDSMVKHTSQIGGRPELYSDNLGTVTLLMSDSTKLLSIDTEYRRSLSTQAYRVISHYPEMYSRGKPVHEDTDIWLVDMNGVVLRRVTEGMKYYLPLIAPNGLLLTCNDINGNTIVLDTLGTEVAKVYNAQWECWAPTSDAIYFTRTVDGDGDIIGGDLYRLDIPTQAETRLTFTPDIVEKHPRVSPTGTSIAYRTYHKSPDGLEVMVLKGGQQ